MLIVCTFLKKQTSAPRHIPEKLQVENKLRHKCQSHVTRMQMYRMMLFIKWLRTKRNILTFFRRSFVWERFESVVQTRTSLED